MPRRVRHPGTKKPLLGVVISDGSLRITLAAMSLHEV
jgi:hypothetical protein